MQKKFRAKVLAKANEANKACTSSMEERGVTENLRIAIEKAERELKENPTSFRPKLALSILKRCQQEFYNKIAINKYVLVPKGKAFEKSLQLKQPMFNIIETPLNYNILSDRFYVKPEAEKTEDSIL